MSAVTGAAGLWRLTPTGRLSPDSLFIFLPRILGQVLAFSHLLLLFTFSHSAELPELGRAILVWLDPSARASDSRG